MQPTTTLRRVLLITLFALLGASQAGRVYAGANKWTTNGPAGGGNVQSIAIDPVTPAIVYAGSSGGSAHKSVDGGAHWTAINTGLVNNVARMVVDPKTPSTVYAGTDSGVYKSTDSGGHWNPASDGLTNSGVNALAINPASPSILYVGNGGGVYESTNSGGHWDPVDSGFPVHVWVIAFRTPRGSRKRATMTHVAPATPTRRSMRSRGSPVTSAPRPVLAGCCRPALRSGGTSAQSGQ